MTVYVRDLVLILSTYFPAEMTAVSALYLLLFILGLHPLLRLHRNQRTNAGINRSTGWHTAAAALVQQLAPLDEVDAALGDDYLQRIAADLPDIHAFFELDREPHIADLYRSQPPPVLCTAYVNCPRCAANGNICTLRKRIHEQRVTLMDAQHTLHRTWLATAHCPSCLSNFFPDRFTFKVGQTRYTHLEVDAQFLRVSKSGVWCHRAIARTQENAVRDFHAGWSSFSRWFSQSFGPNTVNPDSLALTARQSQRLFVEHFARRLISAHHISPAFLCPPNPSTNLVMSLVVDQLGKNGGLFSEAMTHVCLDCTHPKRYREDLVAQGAQLAAEVDVVVGAEPQPAHPNNPVPAPAPPMVAPAAGVLPAQQRPPNGPNLYVTAAVMDGKTLGHKLCAVRDCSEDLQDYKSGRFCSTHARLADLCGIAGCGSQIEGPLARTCADPAHRAWYRAWSNRFGRVSFQGVHRVIRQRQYDAALNPAQDAPGGPQPQRVALPALGDTPGHDVSHLFTARKVYCIQTLQWACGFPIGWGKCHTSENAPRVVEILDSLWQNHPGRRPSFIFYDRACDLLRHLLTQHAESAWHDATRFIVDAWHYVSHSATDIICRTWCNPAPGNGTQPDLILPTLDAQGRTHLTRAFNTETAEQLNAWLDGFEAHTRHMSATSFDFFIYSVMLLHKETVQARIEKKGRGM